MVEANTLEETRLECSEDEDERRIHREKNAIYREKVDEKYKTAFAAEIRRLFPSCPENRDNEITQHACEKGSGRVGRCIEAKELSNIAIKLAVRAHIRHKKTGYDDYLNRGYSRGEAREIIKERIDCVYKLWLNNNG